MIDNLSVKNIQTSSRHKFLLKKRRAFLIISILIIILICLSLLALSLGNTYYPLDTVIKVLRGESIKGATFAIMTLRVPRLLTSLLVGIAFGMAGSTFQTMLRNPLASPDIIGITAGSSVTAVFCILVLKSNGVTVAIASVISGLVISMFIYYLSKGGHFSGGRLVLIGIGVQAILNSVISFLLLKASQYDIPAAMRWLSGSLNGIRLTSVVILLPIVLVFGTLLSLLSRQLRLLELGEASAITLGVRTHTVRILLVICSVVLLAFSTSITGPIAFVSFLSGPIAKRAGLNSPLAAGFTGSILVLSADLIGQFALPYQYPVGVVTGLLGAPYLLFSLVKLNKNGGSA